MRKPRIVTLLIFILAGVTLAALWLDAITHIESGPDQIVFGPQGEVTEVRWVHDARKYRVVYVGSFVPDPVVIQQDGFPIVQIYFHSRPFALGERNLLKRISIEKGYVEFLRERVRLRQSYVSSDSVQSQILEVIKRARPDLTAGDIWGPAKSQIKAVLQKYGLKPRIFIVDGDLFYLLQ